MDVVMEYPGVKVETAEEEHLEDLIIIKEGDVERVVEGGTEPITGKSNDKDSSAEEDATARHGQIGKANTESGDGDKRKKDNQINQAKGETGTEDGVEHIKGMDELAQRLTPYFPDALYDLVFTLQEGRRLNDQRCSFRGRRRCHSEPNTYIPAHRAHRVHFSSMTSLQKDEFFDLLATSQGRRLDDQRAELHDTPPPKPKANKKRSSVKDTKPKKSAPIAVQNEDLYNMILMSQAQGRLEEQRSAAPGPMDDEDFFSLLLSVQGGRMEDQRTELPGILGT
ncbi:G-protein-signaling modulator 1-like isoform X2 [Salvelinus namaycush]|uniref:G-protein-signaling modulator 1-like isoform X2 n=1 Tax=Salvelinus namaycush TaxID=8040 RepID=A0A8U0QUV9_SALNM|nr:G-protein-signaling modulator 1-like isoform X2 [Salvelinus namaycush]